jgi:hypothetical protein
MGTLSLPIYYSIRSARFNETEEKSILFRGTMKMFPLYGQHRGRFPMLLHNINGNKGPVPKNKNPIKLFLIKV